MRTFKKGNGGGGWCGVHVYVMWIFFLGMSIAALDMGALGSRGDSIG